MIERHDFGNSPVERIQTRFRIAGANGLQFNAIDFETISCLGASFKRSSIYHVAKIATRVLMRPTDPDCSDFSSDIKDVKPYNGYDFVIDYLGVR